MTKRYCHRFNTEDEARAKCPFELWCDEAVVDGERFIAACNHENKAVKQEVKL